MKLPTPLQKLPVSLPWLIALVVYYLGAVVLTHIHKVGGAGSVALGLVIFHRPLGRLLGLSLLNSWKELNLQSRLARQEEPTDAFDYKPLVVLGSVAVSLTLIEYFGDRETFRRAINHIVPGFIHNKYYGLAGYAYWSGARVVGYVALPFFVVLALPGERFRDHGLSFQGFWKHLWIYVLLFLIVLFPVIMVSYTRSFQHTYPFYKMAVRSWTDFLAWEALYAVQFFALEVFFRGFMLHPLKRALGSYAIFVMAVPYCMIHYNKPLAEVLGAVVAGIILGTLSLQTGSIWCGVLIHVSVAVTMDSLSMYHTAGYPGNPRLVL